jgi:predicted aconitase with swiveling domain
MDRLIAPTSIIVAGTASGRSVVTDVPLSFWGGLDPDTAEVIDRRHPLLGVLIAGQVLVMPSGRGSCTASGVLLETIRNGVAPAAIILSRVDPIVGLGSILGQELYGVTVPVIVIPEGERRAIDSGQMVRIDENGTIALGE